MKMKILRPLAMLLPLVLGTFTGAQETVPGTPAGGTNATPPPPPPPSSGAQVEVKAVVEKMQKKFTTGHRTEADLAPEMKELDGLVTKYKADKPEDAAQVLMVKA